MSSDCPDPAVFSAFVSGALSAEAREALELHVDTCEACRITLSEAARGSAEAIVAGHALPAIGELVDRYTITGELGAGAMGVVYRAHDRELDRELAIKLVQPQPGVAEDTLVQQRMLREGRALARIDHPNVVRVLDVGRWHDSVFVAMEHVAGRTLRAWLAETRPSPAAIVDVFAQCAAGLAAAHAAGIVHRDFKPDNAIVDDRGRARVTDFGLAITGDAVPIDTSDAPSGPATDDPKLTRTHGLVGTPAYMAPEQHRGVEIDERADQFALCVALAEALQGERPFAAASLAAIEAGPTLRARIPRRIRRVLARGLAVDPARRFASLDALARALRPPPRRWPIVAGAGAIVTVAAIALAWPATDDETCTITPVDAVWNPARDQRIAAAFAAAGQRFAGPASSYARAAIERYVAQWSVLRDATCRAAQPAVARCLDRRATELDALLVRWERGDREDLASASQAVDALVPVERCGSPEVDAEPGALVPTAQLRAYERRLAAAHARFVAGEIEQAAADLAALDRELAATPFRALRAEVLLELAGDERDLGRPDPARDHLVAAVATAETAGAARIKALAWIELVALAADDGVRLPEARDALRLATAVIEHLGNPAELAEQRDLSAGLLALREGDHPRALELLRPVAIASSLAVTDRARRLQILARALVASGDVAAGLAELERAEHVLIEALGPDTPQLVFVYNSMIEPLDYLGRQRDAIARGERALAIVDASFGRDYPRRLVILDNVATIYANLGELDHALELQREVISGTTRVRGPDSYALAVALVNFGSTLVDAKRYAESIAPLDRGLAILSRLVRPEHPVIATAHATLAHAHSDLGHHALAIEHARRALAIREQLSTGPGYLAYNRFLLAEVLRAAGQLPEAIALVRSALALPLAKTGREGELAAQLRAWLASRATVARSGTDSP